MKWALLRKIEKNSLIHVVYICKVQMAGNEKLYQMVVLSIAPHSNTQLHVECSVLFSFTLIHVCQLIYFRATRRKKLLKNQRRHFVRNRLRNLTVVCFMVLYHLISRQLHCTVQVVSFNYNLFTYARVMIYFVLTCI